MLQGSFGTAPWNRVGVRAVAGSTAAAGEGSAPAQVAEGAQLTADTPATPEPEEESSEEEENFEDELRARMEEEQLAWDETVQALMDMEITQRKNEGDLEGHEKGLNFRLRFNIWKTEKEWKFQKEHEA